MSTKPEATKATFEPGIDWFYRRGRLMGYPTSVRFEAIKKLKDRADRAARRKAALRG